MDVQDPTRVRLIQAAGEEFAEKGFAAARVREICERAGANVAAVNYHFGDKEQLYVETVVHVHGCGNEEEPPCGEDAGPETRLRAFIGHFLARVLAIQDPQDWRHRLMLRELILPTAASDVLVRTVIRPKFNRLMEILRELRPEAEERRLHALAFSIVGQCMYYRMGRPVAERVIGSEGFESLDLEFLTEHISSFSLAAIKAMEFAPAAAEPDPAAAGVK